MTKDRKTALAAGGLYLVTFIASIPALILKDPLLEDPDFILGSGSSTGLVWASFLEVITALAGIGTAVALYRVTKRWSQGAAIGFVTSRVLEAGTIFTGVISMLSLVTVRDGGGDPETLTSIGSSLVAVHDWTFLLGPGVMAAVNAVFLGSVLYRSGLVPRWIPTLGLIGAPLLFASDIATLFGLHDQVSATAFIAVLPVAVWEMSVGLRMLVKGFVSPASAEPVASERPLLSPAAA
jgi:hypothetical protein